MNKFCFPCLVRGKIISDCILLVNGLIYRSEQMKLFWTKAFWRKSAVISIGRLFWVVVIIRLPFRSTMNISWNSGCLLSRVVIFKEAFFNASEDEGLFTAPATCEDSSAASVIETAWCIKLLCQSDICSALKSAITASVSWTSDLMAYFNRTKTKWLIMPRDRINRKERSSICRGILTIFVVFHDFPWQILNQSLIFIYC